jgi:hypothetical protein
LEIRVKKNENYVSLIIIFVNHFEFGIVENMEEPKNINRAYNLILHKTPRESTTYLLLGLENGKVWNLLGGQQEPGDKNRGITASRELYEESATIFDKRGDVKYWERLKSYEHTIHKVFIHPPGELDCDLLKLNVAAKKCREDTTLPHDFKEMHRYTLVKFKDILELALQQKTKGYNGTLQNGREHMIIDGWMLYTLQKADKTDLMKYV